MAVAHHRRLKGHFMARLPRLREIVRTPKTALREVAIRQIYARLPYTWRDRFHAVLNSRFAIMDPAGQRASRASIRAYVARLATVHASNPPPANCGYLHFVFLYQDKVDFPLFAYLAVQSARHHNPGWPVVFSYMTEPTGPWWDRLRGKILTVPVESFDYFAGARIIHYAHKADVIRLLALRELGGFYLDIDTITVKSFAPLLAHEFGMAVQAAVSNSSAGLCNAVMWGQRRSRWVRLWLRHYSSFRSKGHDGQWDYHSVRLPALLLRTHTDLISILDHRAFFYPLWPDVERVLFSEKGGAFLPHMEPAYGFHLWRGAIEKRLSTLDPDWIASSKSLYAHFARPVLASAP